MEIARIHRHDRRNRALIGVPPLQNLGKGDKSATRRQIWERFVTGFIVAVVVAFLGKGEQSSRIFFAENKDCYSFIYLFILFFSGFSVVAIIGDGACCRLRSSGLETEEEVGTIAVTGRRTKDSLF